MNNMRLKELLPLPGFAPAKPMVFSGIYATDADAFGGEDLRAQRLGGL